MIGLMPATNGLAATVVREREDGRTGRLASFPLPASSYALKLRRGVPSLLANSMGSVALLVRLHLAQANAMLAIQLEPPRASGISDRRGSRCGLMSRNRHTCRVDAETGL